MQKISVCVIVPCFNSAQTIERAIDSLLAQTLHPPQIILVDDCSCDETVSILEGYRQRHPELIQIIALSENHGPSYARNIAWDRASTDYVAFLDADDIWLPTKLEQQHAFISSNKNVIACGHGFGVLIDNVPQGKEIPNSVRCYNYKELLFRNRFSTPTMMVQRAIDCRFPEHLRGAEDYTLWLDIAYRYGPIPKLTPTLAYCYKELYGQSGLSSQLLAMERAELEVIMTQYRQQRIGYARYTALYLWSLFKFFARVLKTWGRRIMALAHT